MIAFLVPICLFVVACSGKFPSSFDNAPNVSYIYVKICFPSPAITIISKKVHLNLFLKT